MRFMKLGMVALIAVCAFSTMAAGSASAFHPLFLTQSKKALLFTGEGGKAVLRALEVSVLGTIECEKSLAHGFILDKSTLAREVHISFHGKCTQTVGTSKTACAEPIKVKLASAELGLISAGLVGVAIAPESGTEFVEVTCGTSKTKVEGSIVCHIPLNNALVEDQLNTDRNEFEMICNSIGNSDLQEFNHIELLGTNMTNLELKTTGFFGGKASEQAVTILKPDGLGLICTSAPAACQ